jgi:hypothetical protein
MIADGPPSSSDSSPTVYWTATALEQLQAILSESERAMPASSQRLAQRLTLRSAKIAEAPRASAVNPEFQAEEVREVSEGPYRLIFLHQPNRIDILAVIKSAGIASA